MIAKTMIEMITDSQIEKWMNHCIVDNCKDCPFYQTESCTKFLDCLIRSKIKKDLSRIQLKELLSALYQKTNSEQGFTLYRKDIVELAKDYGISEEELK